MMSIRHARFALALSLALTVAGALSVMGPATASPAASNPVGGHQLASAGVIVDLEPGVPPPPAMPGASFLLADMDTGQILVARAPHALHLTASTMKTLTALTLIPLLDPNTKITVEPQDVAVDGTHLGILAGVAYSVGELLQGMLMESGNDAAYALARGNHSMAVTLQEMNATAADLGAFDTVAKDPSGLDHAGQASSAYDLALIGRAAMELPAFRRDVMTKQASLPGGTSSDGKPSPGFNIGNHNQLLYNYQGEIGIKNGYTKAAKFTYMEAAMRRGKTYLLTEMSSPDGSWRPAAALLDWAFAHGPSVTPIGELVEPGGTPASKPTVAPAGRPWTAGLAQSPPTTSHRESASKPAQLAWTGMAGGLGALILVGTGAWRYMSRRRRGARLHPLETPGMDPSLGAGAAALDGDHVAVTATPASWSPGADSSGLPPVGKSTQT
jgi:D-alanyl-D-alanine carboxypeptidase (penicillin-binding protein 5/6)